MSSDSKSAGEYKVYYHTACKRFWGRAIGPVLALDAAGATFTIQGPEAAPKGIGFAVPMVTLPSGQTLSQTPGILAILGENLGLNGSTQTEKNFCMQSLLDVQDIFSEAAGGKWKAKPERADKWLGMLESRLKKTKFLVTDKFTVADCHAVFAFMWVMKCYSADATKGLDSKGAKSFPNVQRWWDDVCKVPAVSKMMTSGIAMIP